MKAVYLSKSLAAASSSGIGTISTAAVTTLNTANAVTLDTGRKIILWSSNAVNLSGGTFTITGQNETGGVFSETVTGSTGSNTVATVQDFKVVTKIVSNAGAPSGIVTFGTNTQGSTPWKLVDQFVPVTTVAGGVTFSSTANNMIVSMEYTFDGGIMGTNPNPNLSSMPVWVSTSFSSVTGPTAGCISNDGQISIPIYAYRMTLTSTSSGAGTVYASVMQSGVGG